jgi:hypothetical protein
MKLYHFYKFLKVSLWGTVFALALSLPNSSSAHPTDEHSNGIEQKLANQGMKKLEAGANPLAGLRRSKNSRTNTSQTSPDLVGQWSAIINTPVIPIFASLLPNGNVLMWDSVGDRPTENYPNQTSTRVAVWNPNNNTFTRNDVSGFNIFCAGYSHLINGKLFVAGGNKDSDLNGIRQTHIFDYTNNSWSRGPDMAYERWYPSVASLANGEQFVMAGGPDTHEVLQLNNIFRVLTSAILPHPRQYPFIQTSVDGRVFYAGPDSQMRLLNTQGTGQWQTFGNRDGLNRSYGSYAMFDIGKFLVLGGGRPPTNSAVVIDVNSGSPVVAPTSNATYARRQHNLTALPDGSVLATGGLSSNASTVDLNAGVYAAELWNPETGRWRELSSAMVTRQYHSTALLLPDGRVMTGGGGICGDCQRLGYLRKDMEIFSPPYLFKPDGSGALADRPTITYTPQRLAYDRIFRITTPEASSIGKVSLIKLGAPTHSQDMEQRYIPLKFTRRGGNLNLISPANANIAPPGYYMLFVVNNRGVPSIAKMIQLKSGNNTTFTSTLVAKHSNKCLDVPGAQNTNGLILQQFTCNGTNAQKFQFQLVSGTTDTYKITNFSSAKCVEVYGGYPSNGNYIVQSLCNQPDRQQFRLEATSNGYYRLIAKQTNKCLDVYGGYDYDGAKMIQWACDTRYPSQEFAIAF